ncbi:MAG TPA: T9SS type A sorting domain-containing protein [Bacteroidia bacterium]|nr:T9SS type A sorting domain-containing protein [Bacteroidia bacterium]HRS58695.1 T9SS type A sorting domain-containing protein [Bacteroidia bacterium]
MKKLKLFMSIISWMFIFFSARGQSSISAGEITWTSIGNDSFLIKLSIYRDCNGSPPGIPTVLIKCKSTGAVVTTVTMPNTPAVDITPICRTGCTKCQSSNCSFPFGIEQYIYSELVVLSGAGSCCELSLEYSECCRSDSISTLTSAGNSPFYLEAMLNRCITPYDNSPQFTNPPVAIICKNNDFVFSQGVINNDLDSLSFELTTPLISHGVGVSYVSPYSFDKPLYFNGFPDSVAFLLNQNTGVLSFRPMKTEQAVIAVKVSEWRKINGIPTKTGETTREILIIIMNCTENLPPVLSGPYYKEVFAGENVTFSIATNDYDTHDTLLLSWEGNIPAASWSTNNKQVKHPTGILTWQTQKGDARNTPYFFIATVKDDNCPINLSDTRVYQILVKDSSTMGMNEYDVQSGFRVYPNPATDRITIESMLSLKQVEIFNVIGARIRMLDGNDLKIFQFERGQLSPGLYFMKVTDIQGNNKKFSIIFE